MMQVSGMISGMMQVSGMMQELQGPCMPYCLCSQRAALRAHSHPMH